MKLFIQNGKKNIFLWGSLNVLRWTGFLLPDEMTPFQRKLRTVYTVFWFMFIVGIMTIAQIGDLIRIWGNVPLMVETSYLLFTYFVYILKIINLFIKTEVIFDIIREGDEELDGEMRKAGMDIIESSNRDMIKQLLPLVCLYGGSVFSWGATEDHTLLFRAWYPMDVTVTPLYEVAYVHQSVAVMLLALTNGSFDVLVICLSAVCRCRIELLKLSLKTIFEDIQVNGKLGLLLYDNGKLPSLRWVSCDIDGTRTTLIEERMFDSQCSEKYIQAITEDVASDNDESESRWLISDNDDKLVCERLRSCIISHQTVLESGYKIRSCFAYSILAQFTVSMMVLCVSAYQLGEVDLTNKFRVAFMLAYLFSMAIQVFAYCYEGNQLAEESINIAETLYEIPWYACSGKNRSSILVMMIRSRRAVELSAGGFATLSLGCFMSIIKVSYSFFTVLQQVDE